MPWSVGDTVFICKAGYRAVSGSVISIDPEVITVRRAWRKHSFDARTRFSDDGSHLLTSEEMDASLARLRKLMNPPPEGRSGWRD